MRASCVTAFLKKTTGSMTVEFVLVVPILLAALAFSYEFGRAFWAYDVMTRDVRASVRYLSRLPRPPAVNYPPFDAAAQTKAINVAMTGGPSGGTTHFPWGPPWSTCTTTCVSVGGETNFSIGNYNENGFVFSVTGTVPLNLQLLGFLTSFLNYVASLQNSAAPPALSTNYTLTVTDRARYIGN